MCSSFVDPVKFSHERADNQIQLRWMGAVSDPNLRSSTCDCQRLRGFKALKRNSLRRSFVLTETLAHPGKRYSGKFGGKRWASRWTVSLQFLLRGWSFGEAWLRVCGVVSGPRSRAGQSRPAGISKIGRLLSEPTSIHSIMGAKNALQVRRAPNGEYMRAAGEGWVECLLRSLE